MKKKRKNLKKIKKINYHKNKSIKIITIKNNKT